MFRTAILIISLFFLFGCVSTPTRPPLKDYQPKSEDEAKIIDLLVKRWEAYENSDAKGVFAIYAKDAMIYTDKNCDYKEKWYTYDEYVSFFPDLMARYKRGGLTVYHYTPQKIVIDGNHAEIEVPYYMHTFGYRYEERGILRFEFRKTGTDWLVTKRSFELECSSEHPKFKKCP